VIAKPGPVQHFERGPAMKYNRWLAQPNSLGLVFANDAACDTIATEAHASDDHRQ
jgi:hypothetical protein